MKKSLLFVFGLGAMMASCTSDEPIVNGEIGAERQVEFTLNLPDGMATRSTDHNSWVESGKGGVSNNMGEDVTFNVALYLDGNEIFRETQTVQSSGNHTSATFRPTLIIGETYHLVAYAEFDTDANSIKLDAIPFKQAINDEKIDEYFVQTNVVAAPQLSAELKRPYGKLRLLADDWKEAERQFGSHIESISVTYNNGRPSVFNATTGLFGEAAEGTTSFTDVKSVNYAQGTFTYTNAEGTEVTEAENTDYKTIFVDYIPVNEGDLMVPFTVTVEFEGGQTFTRDFRQDIPVHRNWLTTLKGNLFTMDSELTLYIEENFDDEVVRNYNEDIEWIAANGGTYTLTEDVILDETLIVTGNMVLDLNGKTITNKVENTKTDVIIVREGASLTINGTEGGVTAVTGNDGYAIIAEGKVVLNGGTYLSGLDLNNDGNCVVYARGNGEIVVNGGYFDCVNDDAKTYLLNKQGSSVETASIKVYGGTFKSFNPQNNPADGANTNYVADGYKAIQDGETFVVVPEEIDALVSTEDQLTTALKNGENVLLLNEITSNAPLSLTGGVLDGNGYTINANSGADDYESGVCISQGILQNVVVKGAYRALGVGGSGAYEMTGDAYYKNVTTEGSTYGFNIGVGNGHWLYVDNCTVGDWNSYSGLAGATFTNCRFISAGKYYAIQRISASATFTYKNCIFEQNTYDAESGEKYNLDSYGNGTIVLENCKMADGTAITSENVSTLFNIDTTTARKVNVVVK